MRNDSVIIPCFARGIQCQVIFAVCSTHKFIDNYSTTLFHHKKCQPMGRMSIEKRGRAVGLIEKPGIIESCSLWIIGFDMFNRAHSVHVHLKMSVIFIVALAGRRFSIKYCILQIS